MNIVFVLGEYYPNFSAVGKCVSMVADKLAKKNNVKIVCFKSNSNEEDFEKYNNQFIYRTNTNDYIIREKFIKKIKSHNKFLSLYYKFLYNLYKVKVVLKILFSKTTIYKEKVTAFLDTLKLITDKIDIIIPCCFPMESVVAALEYKKIFLETKIIPYLFDPYTESLSLHRLKINKIIKKKNHLKIEEEMLKNSEKIIVMKHLYQHFIENFNSSEKIVSSEHPVLIDKVSGNNFNEVITMVYAGIFQSKVRNPKPFLKLMEKALQEFDAQLNIYAYGNCDSIIKKYAKNNSNKIMFFGKVSSQEAEEALKNNNILISVGNKDNTQVPSKIIEYMSYGKPIIHFYTNKDDNCIKILKEYDLALLISINDEINQNVEKIKEFCNMNKDSYITFDKIKEKFEDALPEFVVEKVIGYD